MRGQDNRREIRRFLSKFAEATKKIPLEEPDHWIKLPEGCTPWFTTTSEYSTMYHDLPRIARFWSFLLTVDQDLAEETRKKACPCGGRLHSANYLRKPRGTPVRLPEQECLRLSFCCDRDGCRKRATPPSVRFLGRKVYLGAIVILISAMRQGPSPSLGTESLPISRFASVCSAVASFAPARQTCP